MFYLMQLVKSVKHLLFIISVNFVCETVFDYCHRITEVIAVGKMIRSLIRCTRMYKNVLVSQTKYTIPIMHHISEGRKHKSHSIPNLTTEESESIPPNVNHESVARSIRFLHKKLNCTKEQAEEICIAYPDLVGKKFLDTSKNLEFLLAKGVRADVILDNPRILTRNHRKI